MVNRRKSPFPKESVPLKIRIQAWRDARNGPGPMPDDLWNDAIHMAKEHGVCRIARAIGIDYSGLRNKVRKAMEIPAQVKPAFIELSARPPAETAMEVPANTSGSWAAESGSLIEISRPDGSQMRIHLEAGRGAEAAGIVAAFLRSRG